MLDMLTLGWPDLNPRSVSMDYEKGLMNAFGAYFPQAQTHGCFFHLVQSVKRHIASCGLSRRYRTEPDFALKAKQISAIAFAPTHRIEEALSALRTDLPSDLQPVLDYFEDNYVGKLYMTAAGTAERRVPTFSVSMWTVYNRTLNDDSRTNNYVEAFHRSLQSLFGVDHPSLFKCEGLKMMQHTKDAQMERFISGNHLPKKRNKYVRNDLRIKRILDRTATCPIIETLRGIAHTYDMNPSDEPPEDS